MKIMIIGSSGSGKSTFSRKLGEALNITVYHLDVYFWKPGWVETPREEWIEFNKQLVMKQKWIIDGYYGSTMDIRVHAAGPKSLVLPEAFPEKKIQAQSCEA
ncbi:adenylate kinase family enzyme [Fontibacillus solani]|uniref:Adenylate kinase family enzyme n=1 Tax=Fontibacillus solani TaxID=1572857 RepID=A0A7W3XS59_9BACL|nr:hypothetical protein [Fontibacillus solani]MBA9086239.1 adenylate kinase family enzyme [Fontibacillus solani]